jgi:hypothetical protein
VRYFNQRVRYPRNFDAALPSLSSATLATSAMDLLDHRDSKGRRIFVFRVAK